jgi:hypothetical protein
MGSEDVVSFFVHFSKKFWVFCFDWGWDLMELQLVYIVVDGPITAA